MSLYLGSSIISARLSNGVPGLISGTLTVAGLRDPLTVELRGNFLRDIAGCTVELRNPIPDADAGIVALLADHQTGDAGEMTASRRITQMLRKARPPKGYPVEAPRGALKNLLFLEWFNQQQQRIVIQSWHWNVSLLSSPTWIMPKEMEPLIIKQNRERRKAFLLEDRGPRQVRKSPSDIQPEIGQTPMTLRDLLAEHVRQTSPAASQSDPLCGRAAQLSAELMVLEGLLSNPDGVRKRPTLAGLLQSIADLCGQLAQTMGQFTTLPRGQWAFLITDVEQSMMLLSAAVNVCDAALKEHEEDINRSWLDDAHRQIARLQSEIANFLRALAD